MSRFLVPLLIGSFTLVCILIYRAPSPDLMAVWMAGHFLSLGQLDQIYAAPGPVYLMYPPDTWVPYLRAQGYGLDVYPFVYPPLWAALMGWVSQGVSLPAFTAAAHAINPALLGAMVWIGVLSDGGDRDDTAALVALGLALMLGTQIGNVALLQNQPQILVSLLIIAALALDRQDRPVWAGGLLAVAAAIKLYPALIAVIWLIGGRSRSAAAFAAAGLSLAMISVAVAGWPLHAAFLDQVRTISGTVFLSNFTFSLDAMAGALMFWDALTFVPATPDLPGTPVGAGWHVMAKPALWSVGSGIALGAIVGVAGVLLRRGHLRDPLGWALILLGIGLLSPLSWGYHYLTVLAFCPLIVRRIGWAAGGAALGLCFCLVTVPALGLTDLLRDMPFIFPVRGTLSMLALGVVLIFCLRQGQLRDQPMSGPYSANRQLGSPAAPQDSSTHDSR